MLDPTVRFRLEHPDPLTVNDDVYAVEGVDLRAALAALDAATQERDSLQAERDDLAQRLSRVLTHDGSVHGCCWDARTTMVQTVVPGVEHDTTPPWCGRQSI